MTAREPVISAVYFDSGEPVRTGDRVSLDGHLATIEGVLSAGSQEAADWYCEDTGAVRLSFDEGWSAIILFGSSSELKRIDSLV